MARSLIELYRGLGLSEAGPKGRTLTLSDIARRFPNSDVRYDHDVASRFPGNPSFRVDDNGGLFVSVSDGGGHWIWDPSGGPEGGGRWTQHNTRPGGGNNDLHAFFGGRSSGLARGERGRGRANPRGGKDRQAIRSVLDRFSKTEGQYRATLDGALANALGEGWKNLIDSAYGRGATDRCVGDLWRNLWTDYEAAEELTHYYDVAQQAAQAKQADRGSAARPSWMASMPPETQDAQMARLRDAVGSYPMSIGPRYDIPNAVWGDEPPGGMWGPQHNDDNPDVDQVELDIRDPQYVRKDRVTDASYFDNVTGYA